MEMKQENANKNYWLRVIVMLCLGWVTIWIYRSSLNPLFSEIQQTVGQHTNAQMGLISSCYFVGAVGMQIPSGILVDKFGKKTVLIPGFIAFALAAFLIAQAKGLTTIYIASVIAGMGCGCYFGTAYSLTSESIPADRKGISTAIINSGSAVGMGIGMILSSLFVKQIGLPWQTMMYICFGLILTMLVVFVLGIKTNQTQKSTKKTQIVEEVVVEEETEGKKGLFSPKMLVSYLLYFGTCYGYYMVVTWLPAFLQDERGFKGIAIGFSSALVAFAAIPGALIFSRLSDKYRTHKTLIILLLEISASLMLLLTVSAQNSTLLLVGLILYGFLGKLAVEPIIISHISDHASKKFLGTTLGVSNFFGLSASIFAPTITGVISDASGTREMGFYISIIIMAGAAILFFLVNSFKKEKKDTVNLSSLSVDE
ncbi:Sugar phosphate permease [Pilibacter termitis]|uniref:Sugar phosphate permease n=1 Tax=Pilibacter termitis TaxID=263852 RepID=A0A1T4LCC0_9ENTE|nr:MFS transporter [Pilibacter termitis]SJZ52442.1 Sugar phosphate permease [Pilibacter termitis]